MLNLNKMKKIVLPLLLLSSLFFSHLSAQDKRLSVRLLKQLNVAEKAMVNAITSGDSVGFKEIAGNDYIDINAFGMKMTLPSMLLAIHEFKGTSVNFSDQSQRVYGNFVLKSGTARFYVKGQLNGEVYYTQGWVYRGKNGKSYTGRVH
jgi:hypothetical protein